MRYYLFRHVECTRSSVCGLAMLSPGWKHMRRCLENESVLIFGKKNSTLIDIGGETVEVRPNRMVLLPARVLHEGHCPIEQSVSYYWFHFHQCLEGDDELRYFLPKQLEPKEAEQLLSSPAVAYQRLQNGIVIPQTVDVRNSAVFANLCTQILHEQQKPSFSPLVYNNLVQRLLLEVAGECFGNEQFLPDSKSAASALVQKVLVRLEDEISNPDASVKYFASQLNVNADYLGRCFKEVTGIPVGQYIQRRRVELASARLRETNVSIEEIAAQCGFGSRRQFYEEFKRLAGKTPAQYRAESAYVGIIAL